MEEVVLNCERREKANSRYSRLVRREGKIPGIIYGQNREPIPVLFDEVRLTKLVHRETAVITVRVGDTDIKGIIREVQHHPVTDAVLHVDIMGIDVTKKVRLTVAVVLEGTPASLKMGGILEHAAREIEIECLPMDIPEHITVNVSALEIGDAIHAEDIVLENIKILERPDAVIAAVVPPKVEKAAVPTPEEAAAAAEAAAQAEGAEKTDKEED